MKKNDEKNSLLTTIVVIASAIVVAVGVILAIKAICEKYKITERKPKKKFIDFDDADDWTIDEAESADVCDVVESTADDIAEPIDEADRDANESED